MSDSVDASSFLERLNQGNDAAIDEMVTKYYDKLTALAARKMGRHIQAEPESIAVSVMGSMIRGIREKRYQVADSRRLWNLLMTITLHKIAKRAAKQKKEDAGPPDLDAVLASGPTPAACAIFEDLIETALSGLDSTYRTVLLRFLAGWNRTQISEELDITYAAVKYRLNRVLDRLGRLLA